MLQPRAVTETVLQQFSLILILVESQNSNPTNVTTFGDLLKNKIISIPPEEVV